MQTPFTGTVPKKGELLIREYRLRGPNGELDEFIEIYNATDAALTTSASDASPGLAITASDGLVRCVIPNGTLIPARAHLLCANANGYSLPDYPGHFTRALRRQSPSSGR